VPNDPVTFALRIRLIGLLICAAIAAYHVVTNPDIKFKQEVRHETVR